MKNITAILAILFSSALLGFAVFIINHSIKDINDPSHQINWKKRIAVITDFEDIQDLRQVIYYKYKYNNYEFNKIDTIYRNSNVETNIEIYIWFDTNRPNKSILKKESNSYDNIIFGVGFSILPLFFIVFALISIFNGFETISKIKIIE